MHYGHDERIERRDRDKLNTNLREEKKYQLSLIKLLNDVKTP